MNALPRTNRTILAHLVALGSGLALAALSLPVCNRALEVEPLPLSPWLRLAATLLVVAWSHYLVWLFRRMLQQQLSSGYCAALFLGTGAALFMTYVCLL